MASVFAFVLSPAHNKTNNFLQLEGFKLTRNTKMFRPNISEAPLPLQIKSLCEHLSLSDVLERNCASENPPPQLSLARGTLPPPQFYAYVN